MRSTLTAAAVLAAAALATTATGTAYADTGDLQPWTLSAIAPDGSTGDVQPWTTSTATVTDPNASTTNGTSGTGGVTSGRGHVSRSGLRLAVGCQPLQHGIWLVRPGDTLWRVSVCTHHDLTDLVTANHLPDGGRLIYPGDPITVPTTPTTAQSGTQTGTPAGSAVGR